MAGLPITFSRRPAKAQVENRFNGTFLLFFRVDHTGSPEYVPRTFEGQRQTRPERMCESVAQSVEQLTFNQ
jgi:hypothetical protein